MNRIVLIGRLVREPELRYTTGNQTAVCSFTLAVDRAYKNKQGQKEADFIPVVVWGKQGEICGQYLHKGKLTAVDGRLQVRSYEDNEGNRRYATEVIADQVQFLSPKGQGQMEEDPAGFGAFQARQEEEDLPF